MFPRDGTRHFATDRAVAIVIGVHVRRDAAARVGSPREVDEWRKPPRGSRESENKAKFSPPLFVDGTFVILHEQIVTGY